MQSEETTIFREIGVKITNLRAVFGSQTYAISDITAVETKSIPASGCVPAALIAFGLFLIAGSVVGDADDIRIKAVIVALGLLLLFGGLFMMLIPQPSYVVQISTTSEEVKAFTAFDKSCVEQIVTALNGAVHQ